MSPVFSNKFFSPDKNLNVSSTGDVGNDDFGMARRVLLDLGSMRDGHVFFYGIMSITGLSAFPHLWRLP
jgi:hypothetical protein